MGDLVAFLRARLSEDEADARRYTVDWFDAPRVLREVEAIRAIVIDPRTPLWIKVRIAAIWRDHPDFDPGWEA